MEQAVLVEPLLPKNTLLPNQDEEDEEEALDVGHLVRRHSRHPTDGVKPTSSSSSSSSSSSTTTSSDELEPTPASAPINGTSSEHADQEEEKEKQEEEETEGGSGRNEEVGNENKGDKVLNGESDGNGNSVYFDKSQGKWKCRHCNWTHQIGSPCILDVQHPMGYLHMAMNTETLNQWEQCLPLETKGTGSINGLSEILQITSMEINHQQVKHVEDQQVFCSSPALVEQLHKETNTSSKHLDNATKVDSNTGLIGEIEEDLMELDVERVLEKQNTHDLYCPNCNSCITRKVILVRRKPKISNLRPKSKRVKKLDPIPNAGGDGLTGETPETYSNVGPTPAPEEQINDREQEAFSCSSCFSLFIPIGNGCFKIFQFFRQGRKNEHAQSSQGISPSENIQSPQEIRQRESTQSPQGVNPSENTQSPQEINWKEDTQSPQVIIQNENTGIPEKVSGNEYTQSPQKGCSDENTCSPQLIIHNKEAIYPQKVSSNEDTESPQKISHNYDTQSPQDVNQNESKQSPQNIPTARKNWIFSIFAFHKGKATVKKAGHASSVQSAEVSVQSVTNVEHLDGAVINPEEPGISNIFSSTNSSVLDKVKAELWEKKPDADILPRIPVGNEIEDIEAGTRDLTFSPGMEVAPSTESRIQNERGGADAGEAHEWEILKSIVYGGLVESVASLGVVSSAAGAGADTLNILALGLANLIGGLIIIIHNLFELKDDKPRRGSSETDVEEDQYQTVLGRRQNFVLHATVAILSFLIFGLVPPVVYGFSFRKSNDKDLKLAAVAGASLICIILLALGKGHVRKPHRAYFKTLSYYVVLGITTSGISYVVGELTKELVERLGLFESSSALETTIPSGTGSGWASF